MEPDETAPPTACDIAAATTHGIKLGLPIDRRLGQAPAVRTSRLGLRVHTGPQIRRRQLGAATQLEIAEELCAIGRIVGEYEIHEVRASGARRTKELNHTAHLFVGHGTHVIRVPRRLFGQLCIQRREILGIHGGLRRAHALPSNVPVLMACTMAGPCMTR